jgi:hypothetical protein
LRRESLATVAINYQLNANSGSLDRQQLGLFHIGALTKPSELLIISRILKLNLLALNC